MHAIVFR